MVGRVIRVAALAAFATAVVKSLPDIARYLRMRQM